MMVDDGELRALPTYTLSATIPQRCADNLFVSSTNIISTYLQR